jgi:hypothetical protein
MDLHKGMAEAVAPEMPSAAEIAGCKWLTEDELKVYSSEYGRTGFQGGLQGYRVRQGDSKYSAELRMFSGRTIDGRHSSSGKERLGSLSNPQRRGDDA